MSKNIMENTKPRKEEVKELLKKDTREIWVGNVNVLVGRLLTLTEATFPDKTQQEAFKSITKSIIWDWFENCRDMAQGPDLR